VQPYGLWTSFTFTTFQKRRHNTQLDTVFAVVDILFSLGSQCCFIAYSAVREYNKYVSGAELAFAVFYFAATYRRLWLKNFDFRATLTVSTFLDSYCVAIAVYQVFSGLPTWLTPTFIRSVSALIRYEELLNTGLLVDLVGEVKQRLSLSLFRFVVVSFLYACIGFVLEVLGDMKIDWNGDSGRTFTELNPNYETTVFEQLYFVVVTLSTVGYGDFSPNTTLHQIFTIIMIVTGVAFFSSEVSSIIEMRDEIDSGMGQYRRSRFRNYHILVLGGAVTSGSATLQIFLEELLHPSRPSGQLPDVVLMSEDEPGQGLRKILTSPLGVQHVKFIRGSPMDQTALARADAADADMAFVLGNLSALDSMSHAEDEDTILRASLLQRQLPNLPVRLLLLQSWAKDLARSAGINPLCCMTSGVLNFCRTALAVRCPGLPVLLTTMYSKLAGDWSQLPSKMLPWVREYFTSMRHDVYGAQVGKEYDGVPFLQAAADIHKKHGVTLLAVQTAEWNGARLCPAGLVDGHLHVLSEGDVVMALGHDAHSVLRAVGSESKHPDSWRKRFHRMRQAAARSGAGRAEMFSSTVSHVSGCKTFSPNGVDLGVYSNTSRARGAPPRRTSSAPSVTSTPSSAPLKTVHSGEVPPDSPGEIKPNLNLNSEPSLVPPWRLRFRGEDGGGEEDGKHALLSDGSNELRKSKLRRVSTKTRNLCVLTAKLSAASVVRDIALVAKKKRQEGRDESVFTPWITISRIAKTGNHIIVMVDGEQDAERWEELSILLYRLRGNDGCNIKPIVVVSKAPPTVQELTVWRSIEVYVTEGSVSDKGVVRLLGLELAASIVVVADACTSASPLLMDRRVLLATSVLESTRTSDGSATMDPELLLNKVVLEFHHPKSVWHMREMPGFASLASSVRNQTFEDAFEQRYLRQLAGVAATVRRRSFFSSRDSSPSPSVVQLDRIQRDTASPSHAPLRKEQSSGIHAMASGWLVSPSSKGSGHEGSIGGGVIDVAVRESQKDTFVGRVVQGCLKFFGVLDREGGHKSKKGHGHKRGKDTLLRTNADRKSWIERPESHTQYASGKVMFRTEVSRLMATVFYTPGLMELVDALTRDAAAEEDIGHHVRIWSIPLVEELHGKRMGDAFEKYAAEEALVIGMYRKATKLKKATRSPRSSTATGGGGGKQQDRRLSDSDTDSEVGDCTG
jgi:hypothetical protein